MPSPRAPLFSVSLAFATGCVLGLDRWISISWALGLLVLIGIGWSCLNKREGWSLAAFYAFTACAGIVHTQLVATTIARDDLRRLPETKTYPTTQWRGIVVSGPVAQVRTHTARRALDRTTFVFHAQAWRPTGGRYFNSTVDAPWQPASGDIDCTMIGPPGDLACGDRLETAMALAPFPPPLTPGALDYRAYEAEAGIYYRGSFSVHDFRLLGSDGGTFWQNFSFRARDWAYGRLQIGLEDDPRIADFLAGMLIGYREQIPADIEQNFRRTGTLHVFAVSGQNIAELMVVAVVLLQLFGFVRWRWAWALAPVVIAYCLLTGSPASALRATVMVLAVLLAWRLGRPLNALGCWSLTFFGLLVWNPALLLDPGAQLSFSVVLGLILLGPPLARRLREPFRHDPFLPRRLLSAWQSREEAFWHHASQLIGATIAATLVSEPITAIDFHQVTPISVVANLVVVPAAGLITVVGTLSITASLVTTTWAALLNNANWLFARLLIAFVGFLAHKPGASINVPDLRATHSLLPSLIVAPVQDSACLLLRTPHQTWLFNTGRELPARAATSHLLQFYGINRLDGLVLTQISAADTSGAAVIVRDFAPRHLIVPLGRSRSPAEKMLPQLTALAGRPLEYWSQGQRIDLDSVITVSVLNPSGKSPAPHAEANALAFTIHTPFGTLLWAGRIDAVTQQKIFADNPGLRADLLVLDSESTPSSEWLSALHVREWMQFPHHDRGENTPITGPDWHSICRLWPLDQTGSVEIHFEKPCPPGPGVILMTPWMSAPP